MNALKESLIQMVLNELITKLIIINRGKTSRKQQIVKKTPKEFRFKSKVSDQMKRDLDPFTETFEILTNRKQEQEMTNLISVLMETLEKSAARYEDPYKFLKAYATILLQEEEEEQSIITEFNENKRILAENTVALEKLIKDGNLLLKEADTKLANVRCQLKYLRQVNKLEMSLVSEWENSRISQAEIVVKKAESELLKCKIAYEKKSKVEDLVISTVEKFSNIQMNELEELQDEWEEKYNREFYLMYKKNKVLSDELEELHRVHEKKIQIYKDHKAFNEEYLAMIAEREKQMAILKHRVECTIKIQAWWRGVMVRKGFGQYRRKGKKGKKGKKK